MITEVEDYFTLGCGRCDRFATEECSTRLWQAGVLHLRRICRDLGLAETVKWGHPCYMHAGRNIAIIGAQRGDFRLSFMNAALLKDPASVLVKQGPNARHADGIRFTDSQAVVALEPVIRAYLMEAMGYAEAGVRPERVAVELALPEELVAALEVDLELAEAFWALTPGRQRSYVIHLSGAKQAATRVARIARCRDRILAGKGALER